MILCGDIKSKQPKKKNEKRRLKTLQDKRTMGDGFWCWSGFAFLWSLVVLMNYNTEQNLLLCLIFQWFIFRLIKVVIKQLRFESRVCTWTFHDRKNGERGAVRKEREKGIEKFVVLITLQIWKPYSFKNPTIWNPYSFENLAVIKTLHIWKPYSLKTLHLENLTVLKNMQLQKP